MQKQARKNMMNFGNCNSLEFEGILNREVTFGEFDFYQKSCLEALWRIN